MPFLYAGAILHATAVAVISFFILFAAERAHGVTALFGRLLGYWVLLIAIGVLVIGIMHAMNGKPIGPWMHDHWDHMRPGEQPGPGPTPPAKP